MTEARAPSQGERTVAPALKVHATADFSCRLDLGKVCQAFVNCELSKWPSAPVVIHLHKPRSNVKIMADGRVDYVGTSSVDDAHQTLKRVAKRCLKRGFPVRFKYFEVKQVSWAQAYDMRAPINLLQLARHPGADHYLNATRPRVRVPCLTRAANTSPGESVAPTVEALVYANGRVWFCGAQSEQELWTSLGAVLPVLEACRCEKLVVQRQRR
mmetsp:Transcript_12412/g.25214  ORF Transcript_12412/g.25214 Transcript_12412/m.25214 type:complete len:213 (-) Transcript_12412:80-718(-)